MNERLKVTLPTRRKTTYWDTGCYYFGVVNCWNKYIPRERVRRVAGASAGSLIAAYYLMDLPLDKCLRTVIEMTEDIRKRPLGVFDRSNQIVDVLPRLLGEVFPEDAHKRVNGRLYVSMTRLKDMKPVVVNQFDTRQELIEALNCSCFIPVWSGNHVSTYKGVRHIDGGFRNNQPVFDEHTIRVSSFAGPTDIAPYDRAHAEALRGNLQGMPFYWNWKNVGRARNALAPPPASYIIHLLECGFHDAKRFILSNDLIQCAACFGKLEQEHTPIYTSLNEPMVSPAISRVSSFARLAGAQRSGSFRAEGKVARERANGAILEAGADGPADQWHEDGPPTGRGLGAKVRSKLGALVGKPAKRRKADEPLGGSEAPAIVVSAPDEFKEQVNEATSELEAEKEEEDQEEECSPAASPPPAVKMKLRRGGARERRESLPPNVVSPIDLFVRRMSLAPELFERPEVDEEDEDEAAAAAEAEREKEDEALLSSAGRFAQAAVSLPSCPPSPNLNRHCGECIRMRHQARLDLIDEQIVKQAEQYRALNEAHDPAKEIAELAAGDRLRDRLAGWWRALAGRKRRQFYAFEAADSQRATGEIPSTLP